MSTTTQKAIKLKKCKVCRTIFEPRMPMATVCSFECAQSLAVSVRGKAEKAAKVKERRADMAKREGQKSRGRLTAEAQAAFNAFIRLRDTNQTCICCGRPFGPQRPGGSVDAGHYLSRGSAAHLKFDERNVHAQRKDCNRPGGAQRAAFRNGMIQRIGLEALEALESDQTLKHYSLDDLREIKKNYAAKARELKKEQA